MFMCCTKWSLVTNLIYSGQPHFSFIKFPLAKLLVTVTALPFPNYLAQVPFGQETFG